MAFTGDLEHLPIVDIIQLVHTTRKSGFFFVKGSKGESKLVFRNGSIVGANHLNDGVRIGSVLVKTGAVTVDALKQAMGTQKADKAHLPLLATLVQMSALKREDALRGLKKLVELTIVELMSWTSGTFTFDTERPVVPDEGELDLEVDSQMVLMDALRVFDERQRDREAGKEVPSFDALYADVLPGENVPQPTEATTVITAEDLGLADIDKLQKKIPRPAAEMEVFDPVAIQRQKIRELLAEFSPAEQEAFVSFLGSPARKSSPDVVARQAGKALVIFSSDELIKHSLMTVSNAEGVPVFATGEASDLEKMVAQCLSAARMPVVVFDAPPGGAEALGEKKLLGARSAVLQKYPAIPVVQLASCHGGNFFLQSYADGVAAVFPRPVKDGRKETFVQELIQFLDTFKSYMRAVRERFSVADHSVKELRDNIKMLREIVTASDASMVMLAGVAEVFDRAVTFFARPSELIGERAVGIFSEKSAGPMGAERLKIAVSKPSVFRDVLLSGRPFYGESSDEELRKFFGEIGAPLTPAIGLVPVLCDRKVIAIVYGDFGKKEASLVNLDILEILAQQVGIVLEYALFRRQVEKASQGS